MDNIVSDYCPLRPAGSRSAGFTCSYLYLPLSFAGLVNANLRKLLALSADGSLAVCKF